MIGTSAAFLTTQLSQSSLFAGTLSRPSRVAYAAALVVGLAGVIGLALSFFMPEPKGAKLED
jgi:hypothetical protein